MVDRDKKREESEKDKMNLAKDALSSLKGFMDAFQAPPDRVDIHLTVTIAEAMALTSYLRALRGMVQVGTVVGHSPEPKQGNEDLR